MTIAFVSLALLCIALTALPHWRHSAWWVRIWDFPRQQVVVLSVVAAAGLLWAGPPGPWTALLLAALAAAVVAQLWVILPYTRLWRVQTLRSTAPAPGHRTLKVMAANVLMESRAADRLLAVVRATDPDVLLTVETDAWWAERLRALATNLPHAVEQPQDDTYGLVLRSRLELIEPEIRTLVHDTIPSLRTGLRLRSGEVVRLWAIHPEPPSPTEAETSLGRDAELVLVGREVAMTPEPSLVVGDLNDVAWSHTSRLFCRISGLLDPRIGRGFFSTFHAAHPWMRWPLDHLFHSEHFVLRRMERLPAFGSDHFPILVELDYVPKAAAIQEAPEADHDDHAEAHATVAEAEQAVAAGELKPARDTP